MAATAKALKTFFNGFDVPAYTNNTVPEEIPVRHITYPMIDPDWEQKTSLYCEVWDRSTSNEYILRKADEIIKAIGPGLVIPCEGGYIRLHLESPVTQIRVAGDFRSAYINMSMNAFHMPGV